MQSATHEVTLGIILGKKKPRVQKYSFISSKIEKEPEPIIAAFTQKAEETNYKEFAFTNTSKNATKFKWEFGDGSTSTTKDPKHSFKKDGDYKVKLIASNQLNESKEYVVTISVKDPKPKAEPAQALFTYEIDEFNVFKVTFDNTSQKATTYSWDFGDGTNSTSESPSHFYSEVGDYTVKLSAYNADGEVNEMVQTVSIVEPEPVIEPEPEPEPEPVKEPEPVVIPVDTTTKAPEPVIPEPEPEPEPVVEPEPVKADVTVKMGDHEKEIPVGNYVVVGVYSSEGNANTYVKELHKKGYLEAKYGYISVRGYWYVYVHQTTDASFSRKIRNQVRTMAMFKDAWTLEVSQ